MCKDCLKHILKTTGKCPCCQRADDDFQVHIVRRGDAFKELVDDLNFDLDDNQCVEIPCKFTPEQINEEVDDDLDHPEEPEPSQRPAELRLTDPFNDPDSDEDEPMQSIYDSPELNRTERTLRRSARRYSPERPNDNNGLFTSLRARAAQATRPTIERSPSRSIYDNPNAPAHVTFDPQPDMGNSSNVISAAAVYRPPTGGVFVFIPRRHASDHSHVSDRTSAGVDTTTRLPEDGPADQFE